VSLSVTPKVACSRSLAASAAVTAVEDAVVVVVDPAITGAEDAADPVDDGPVLTTEPATEPDEDAAPTFDVVVPTFDVAAPELVAAPWKSPPPPQAESTSEARSEA
jgi:hypothetical protein